MSDEFKCKIEDNKLIIESSPNGKTNIFAIRELLKKYYFINEIIISEGIEKIGPNYFNNLNSITKVTLPNSLKKIGKNAFSCCVNLEEISFPSNPTGSIEIGETAFANCSSLKNLNIENGVSIIGKGAFSNCTSLQNVYLPESLVRLKNDAFFCCYGLRSVRLPPNLKIIEASTFLYCDNLINISFPENLIEIGTSAFMNCSSLKNIYLPNSLIKISYNAFYSCNKLEDIKFNEGLETIDDGAFSHCSSLKEIELPTTLKYIGSRAFSSCNKLKKAIMNDGVIKIGETVFGFCNNLEEITLSNNIKEIPSQTFYDCFNLKKVVLPNSVLTLGEDIFYRCHDLKEVVLSNNIKKIAMSTFEKCDGLKKIVIPEGVQEIEEKAFYKCHELKEVHLPTTLKRIDSGAFAKCRNLSHLYLKNNNEIINLDVCSGLGGYYIIKNPDNLLFSYYIDDGTYGFYKDGKYIVFDKNVLLSNKKIVKLIKDNGYNKEMYIRLYHYTKKRFIPSNIVIENMPLDDINKFYINNNDKEWAKLVNENFYVALDQNKASFFKLCYVLGLFSESTNIRDKAIKFLNENIVNVLDAYDIHNRFDGFDLSNGFNEEYAEFFIKYYNSKDFMIDIVQDEWRDDEEVDLMAASYNNFKNIKKIYPNRTLHTNREADLLLPVHVMNAVRCIKYNSVDDGNEEFSLIVGRYGYTQYQFEKLQYWYNTGKNLTNLSLFIGEDEKKDGITYKLLSKDDPISAVLGNISNCCQVVGGMGESCVEYGMTMPNSGFIIFTNKDKIIGQSWVWYDAESKTICLDNIEIPHRYLEKINQNKTIQKSFVDCLLRIEKSFKEEMNKKGLKTYKVTIGKGYNDINEILDKNFYSVNDSCQLSDYDGYSDANSQYEINSENRNKKR